MLPHMKNKPKKQSLLDRFYLPIEIETVPTHSDGTRLVHSPPKKPRHAARPSLFFPQFDACNPKLLSLNFLHPLNQKGSVAVSTQGGGSGRGHVVDAAAYGGAWAAPPYCMQAAPTESLLQPPPGTHIPKPGIHPVSTFRVFITKNYWM